MSDHVTPYAWAELRRQITKQQEQAQDAARDDEAGFCEGILAYMDELVTPPVVNMRTRQVTEYGVWLGGHYITQRELEEVADVTRNTEITGEDPVLLSSKTQEVLEKYGLIIRQTRGGCYAAPAMKDFMSRFYDEVAKVQPAIGEGES